MGPAAKVKRNKEKGKVDPISSTSGRASVDANQLSTIREVRILPVIKNLTSINSNERVQAIEAIAHLVEDESCRKLLLKERVVQTIMEQTINDDSPEAVMWAWTTLRNLAVEEGYDVSMYMYRKDIMTPIVVTIKKLNNALEPSITKNAAQKRVLWACVENILGLLTSLSESIADAVDLITKNDLIFNSIFALLDHSSAPESLKSAAAMLLNIMTEDNDKLAENIISNSSAVSLLLRLKDEFSPSSFPLISPLRASALCGAVHNVNSLLKSVSNAERIDHDILVSFSDIHTLPRLNKIIQYAAEFIMSRSNSDTSNGIHNGEIKGKQDEIFLALQISLEVITSITNSLEEDFEAGTLNFGSSSRMNVEDKMDEDTDEGDDSEEEIEVDNNDNDEFISPEMAEDMDAVSALEHEEDGVERLEIENSIISQILETTVPLLIPLSIPKATNSITNQKQKQIIQLRALNALNNIAWVCSAHLSPPSSLFPIWCSCVLKIWTTVITPILNSNTASVELAEAITGLSWAIAKFAKGQLDLSSNQHKVFMSLYQAASSVPTKENEDLRTKCIGVLGCLALPQGRVHVNKEIGIFLITILNALPDTPQNAAIEALDAIYDIYADKEFDYDKVFVEMGFLAHLESLSSKVRAMVRKIDRRKEPEFRGRADDVMVNLGRFVQYKRKEQSLD